MINSKSKEETSKSSEQHDLESLLLKSASHKLKLFNANGIKAMKYLLIYSRSEERTPKSNTRNKVIIKYNANGIKTGSLKKISLIQGSNKIQQHSKDS